MPTSGPPVISSQTIAAGVQSNFQDAFSKKYQTIAQQLGRVMRLDVPARAVKHTEAYYEAAPHPTRWKRGEAVTSQNFKDRSFEIVQLDWGLDIGWNRNDLQDDQTGTLMARAMEGGENYAQLRERVYYQMLSGAVNPDLLDSVPNAPDGGPAFSGTDGDGSDRYGVSGGNVVSGSGFAGTGVENDFWTALQRILGFMDTTGNPILDQSAIERGVDVYFPLEHWSDFVTAFQQRFQLHTTAVGGDNLAGTASNRVMDVGVPFRLIPTAYLTGDDWYVILSGIPQKPFVHTSYQPLQTNFVLSGMDGEATRTKQESVVFDSREGFAVAEVYQAVKIDN